MAESGACVSMDNGAHLRLARSVAQRAKRLGRHPFGCVLVDADNTVLFTQGNIDTLNHAESQLCRTACIVTASLWLKLS